MKRVQKYKFMNKLVYIICVEVFFFTSLFINFSNLNSEEIGCRRVKALSLDTSYSLTTLGDIEANREFIIKEYISSVSESDSPYTKLNKLVEILSKRGISDFSIFKTNPEIWWNLVIDTCLQGTPDSERFFEALSRFKTVVESPFEEVVFEVSNLSATQSLLQEFIAQGKTSYDQLEEVDRDALALALAKDVLGEDGDWFRFLGIVYPWKIVTVSSGENNGGGFLGKVAKWFRDNKLNLYQYAITLVSALLTYGWIFGKDIVNSWAPAVLATSVPLFFGVRGAVDLAGTWFASLFGKSLARDPLVMENGIPDNRRTAILYSVFLEKEQDVIETVSKLRLSLLNNNERNVIAVLLSDSKEPAIIRREIQEIKKLQDEFGRDKVFYIHRGEGFGKKWGSYQDLALLLQEGINNPSIYTDPKWDLRKKIYDKNGNLIGVDLGGGFYIDTVNHPGYKEGVFCAPDGQPILVNGQPLQEKDAQIATTYFVEFENGKMVLKNAFGDVVKLGRGLFSKTPVVDNFRVDFKVGKIFVEKSGEVIPLKFDVVAFKVPHTDKYQLFYRGKDIPFATITSSEMMDEGSFLIYFDENKSPNLVSYEGRYLRVHVVGKDYRRDPESQVFTFVGKARKALEDMISAGELSSEERDQLLCLGILGDVSALHIGGVGGEPIRYFAIADQDNVYTPNSIREIIAIAIANPQYGIFQPFLEQANVAESGYARWSANLPQQLLRFTGLGNMVLGSAQFMGKGVIDMNAYREAMMEPGNEALLPFTRCHDFLESINLPTAYLPDVVMKEDAPTSWFIDLLRNKGWRVGDWIGILNEWLPHTTLGRLYNIARGNEDPGPLPPEGRRIMNFILNANLMPIGFAGFLVSNYLGALFPGWIKMGDPVKDLIVLISTFTSIIAIPNFIGAIGYKIQNGEYPSNIARAAQEFVKDLTKGLTNLVISTVTLMQSLYDQPQHVGEAVGEVRNIQRGKPMIWRPMAALEDAQPSSLIEAYRQRAIPVGIATGLLLGAIATSTIYENGGISWAEWASPILSSFIIGPLVAYLTGRSATPIKDAMLEVERDDSQLQRVGDALLSLFGNDLERKFALVKSMFSNIYAETTRLIGNKDTIWNRLTSEQQRRLIDILHVSEEEAKDLIYTYCNSILERKLQNEREKRGKEEAKLQETEEAKAHIIYAQALYTALYWGQWSRDEEEILNLLQTIYEKYGLDGLVLPISKEEKITVDFARFRDDFDKLWAQIIASDNLY